MKTIKLAVMSIIIRYISDQAEGECENWKWENELKATGLIRILRQLHCHLIAIARVTTQGLLKKKISFHKPL